MRRARVLAGIIPPADQLLDLTALRSLEGMRRSQGLLSIGLVGAAALAIWVFMDVKAMLPWLGVMLATFALHFHVVTSLPDRGYRRHLVLPVATLVLSGLAYIAGGMILWVQSDPGLTILSLLFIFVALLNTLSYRVQMRLLLMLDLSLMGVGVLARAVWLWLAHPGTPDTVLVSVALLVCYLYFCRVAWNVMRTRERLEITARAALAEARGQALEQLTGGVAHDFNNLLTAVLGNMELARLSHTAAEREELMAEAERAARRGAELTGQLLAISSSARLRPMALSPDELLQGVPGRAAEVLTPEHELRLRVDPDLPQVSVDAPKLQTCLIELICNARDAMPGGGEIELCAKAARLGAGHGVCFELRDSGTGIPPDLMPLVCEPYFTTKPVGQGSGLGLAMLRGFAEQSGGSFELSSPGPGQGTCARLCFPAAPAASQAGGGPRPTRARAASPAG
ncbi:ATP-binding protein [Salipiger sp. H15]|uniref:histidine kinase n=1 Tax=Alloyangia sp. H15 TaxID=3029062 RepID=A0AAU8APJ9_9RHOB